MADNDSKREGSLPEVNQSVLVERGRSRFRQWLAVAGPALMVSVGYMDPGNWATDLAAGSRYNYTLLWVLLMSNLMAVLLQALSARLGIVRRRDLAQACRETYPTIINIPLYILAEAAVTATDLAEVIGSAIALQLLFDIPLLWGVLLTALDVVLLLLLTSFGIRKLEAVILALVLTICAAFAVEIYLAQPQWSQIAYGFVPAIPDNQALYIAIGILGATVMPHNLYLHSALVQTRKYGNTKEEIRNSIRLNFLDSALSLNFAFLVNAAILIMAAAVFYRSGITDVAEIQDAHRLLEPLLGSKVAPLAFAIALLAAGQSSTITGTLAGQIVMEGYLNFRIRPWLRRLITRGLAIVPAVLAIIYFGESSTGELLILSQVILSLQLPFAVIPLIHFVSNKKLMGEFAISAFLKVLAWITGGTIILLNVWLVISEMSVWSGSAANTSILLKTLVITGISLALTLLGVITFLPLIPAGRKGTREVTLPVMHPPLQLAQDLKVLPRHYQRIALCLDFHFPENRLLQEALRHADPEKSIIYLMHVVESASARAVGRAAQDLETTSDRERLTTIRESLIKAGYRTEFMLGSGNVLTELERMIKESGAELVIAGTHGHSGAKDLLYGSTLDTLRHRISASMLLVPAV
ncbi:MAG: iron/manganese transporter [Candidatus Dadabacteria bacterium]|nr:MAG: iron/manganese transporter [Candidatus Dadabacteria bacterium]